MPFPGCLCQHSAFISRIWMSVWCLHLAELAPLPRDLPWVAQIRMITGSRVEKASPLASSGDNCVVRFLPRSLRLMGQAKSRLHKRVHPCLTLLFLSLFSSLPSGSSSEPFLNEAWVLCLQPCSQIGFLGSPRETFSSMMRFSKEVFLTLYYFLPKITGQCIILK